MSLRRPPLVLALCLLLLQYPPRPTRLAGGAFCHYVGALTVGHTTHHADLDDGCLEYVYKLSGPTPFLFPNFSTELQGAPTLTGPAGGTVGAIVEIGQTESVDRSKWNDFPFKEQMRCECSKSPVFISSISAVHPVHGTVEATGNVVVCTTRIPFLTLRHLTRHKLQDLRDRQTTYE
jgi:hypothetical protein